MRDLHSSELTSLPTEEARRHLDLRREGTALVLGGLEALGLSYTGTGGWHLAACRTTDGCLGFVNTATGCALATQLAVGDALLDALTVPEQGPGQVASGAAAWTSPDVGEPQRLTLPSGWVQLLVDVRRLDVDPATLPLDELAPRMVAWCLPTVYGRRGRPGWARLDGLEATLPTDAWPFTKAQRSRCAEVGAPWFVELLDRLEPSSPSSGAGTSAWPFTAVANDLLRDRGVAFVAALAGVEGSALPELGARLGRQAHDKAQPVLHALQAWAEEGDQSPGEPVAELPKRWHPVIQALARTVVAELLDALVEDEAVRHLEARLLEAYAGAGHVEVDLPAHVPSTGERVTG